MPSEKFKKTKYLKLRLKQVNFHDINVEGNKKKGDNLLQLRMCDEEKIRQIVQED